jgi:hypothetical protein
MGIRCTAYIYFLYPPIQAGFLFKKCKVLMVMVTGSMHMAMIQLFPGGSTHICHSRIKVECLACQWMIAAVSVAADIQQDSDAVENPGLAALRDMQPEEPQGCT